MTAQQIQAEIEERVQKFVPKALWQTATVSFMELLLRQLKDERRRDAEERIEREAAA